MVMAAWSPISSIAASSSEAKASGTRSSSRQRKPTTRCEAISGMVTPARIAAMAAPISESRARSSASAPPSVSDLGQELPQLGQPPLHQLDQLRLLPLLRALHQRAHGGGVDVRRRRGPAVLEAAEAEAVVGEQVDGGVGDPARLVEAVQHHLAELADVDDSGHALPQRVQRGHELEALGEKYSQHLLFDLRLQRLEENQDHERGHHGVEEEQPRRAAGPAHQHAVDERQHHAYAGEDDDLSQQLVQIQQPVALDGLRQEVQINRQRDVGEGRRRPAGEADEQFAEAEAHAQRGADPQVEEPRALGARSGPAHARVQQRDRRGELDEDGPGRGDARDAGSSPAATPPPRPPARR